MPTPMQELIEHTYPGDLPATVAAWVEQGDSWRTIALRVSEAAGRPVSYESLRSWYGRVAA